MNRLPDGIGCVVCKSRDTIKRDNGICDSLVMCKDCGQISHWPINKANSLFKEAKAMTDEELLKEARDYRPHIYHSTPGYLQPFVDELVQETIIDNGRCYSYLKRA